MKLFLGVVQNVPVWLLVFLAAGSVIAGDYFAKYWSVNQKTTFFLLALAGYLFSGIFYTPTLLREGLVVTSLAWSILSIIGFLIIGIVIFKEALSPLQWLGVSFGVISLILLSLEG